MNALAANFASPIEQMLQRAARDCARGQDIAPGVGVSVNVSPRQFDSPSVVELKRLGVRIALDDFGTGYSSLTYLHRLPIDELKIGRSFVAVLDDERSDLVLLQMMVQLGRAFDLKVVAEGIDTDARP